MYFRETLKIIKTDDGLTPAVFRIMRLPWEVDNCCCFATKKCTEFVREFLYAHKPHISFWRESYHRYDTQPRALFFAKLSIYFPDAVTPQGLAFARIHLPREKKNERTERRQNERAVSCLQFIKQALTSCSYFPFSTTRYCLEIRISRRFLRRHGGISFTAQCFAIFNWQKNVLRANYE